MWFNIIVFIFSNYQAHYVTKIILYPRDTELISIFIKITIMLTFLALKKNMTRYLYHGTWCLYLISFIRMSFPSPIPSQSQFHQPLLSLTFLRKFSKFQHPVWNQVRWFLLLWLASLPRRIPLWSSYPVSLQMCQSKSWCWWSTCFLNCHHTPCYKGIYFLVTISRSKQFTEYKAITPNVISQALVSEFGSLCELIVHTWKPCPKSTEILLFQRCQHMIKRKAQQL